MSSRCISHLLFVLVNWCNGQSSSRVENEPEAGGERAPSLKSLELKMVRIGALQSRSERKKRLIITAKIQPARPRGALNCGRRKSSNAGISPLDCNPGRRLPKRGKGEGGQLGAQPGPFWALDAGATCHRTKQMCHAGSERGHSRFRKEVERN